jgi:hypothetical protein
MKYQAKCNHCEKWHKGNMFFSNIEDLYYSLLKDRWYVLGKGSSTFPISDIVYCPECGDNLITKNIGKSMSMRNKIKRIFKQYVMAKCAEWFFDGIKHVSLTLIAIAIAKLVGLI